MINHNVQAPPQLVPVPPRLHHPGGRQRRRPRPPGRRPRQRGKRQQRVPQEEGREAAQNSEGQTEQKEEEEGEECVEDAKTVLNLRERKKRRQKFSRCPVLSFHYKLQGNKNRLD